MSDKIKRQDNISKNAVIYTVGNFLNQAVAVLLSPVFTRLLSTYEYGRVTVYTTWVSLFTIFTGFELAGSLPNAYFDYGEKNYKAYAKSCMTLSILITSLWILIAVLFYKRLEVIFDLKNGLLILALLHSFFNTSVLYLSKYLSLLKRAIPYVLISFGQLVLNIVLSILMIKYSGQNPAISRIWGQFLASAFFGILVILLFLWNKEKILDIRYLKYGLLLSVPLMFHSLGGVILSGSDKIMLSRIANDSQTGLYSFAVTVTSAIYVVSVSFNTAWVPYLYGMLKEQQFAVLKERADKYLGCYTFMSCGFLLIMPEIVKVLANKTYWDCIPLVIPLIMGEFFRFLYFFPVNYEFYKKQNQWIAFATIMTGLINIGLNSLWIPVWGMYGTTLSTLISYILCFAFHEVVARRFIGDFYVERKMYAKYTLILIITSIMAWSFLARGIIRWILAAVYGGILLKRILKEKRLF